MVPHRSGVRLPHGLLGLEFDGGAASVYAALGLVVFLGSVIDYIHRRFMGSPWGGWVPRQGSHRRWVLFDGRRALAGQRGQESLSCTFPPSAALCKARLASFGGQSTHVVEVRCADLSPGGRGSRSLGWCKAVSTRELRKTKREVAKISHESLPCLLKGRTQTQAAASLEPVLPRQPGTGRTGEFPKH